MVRSVRNIILPATILPIVLQQKNENEKTATSLSRCGLCLSGVLERSPVAGTVGQVILFNDSNSSVLRGSLSDMPINLAQRHRHGVGDCRA